MKDKLTTLIAGPTDKTKLSRFGSIPPGKYQKFLDDRASILAEYVSQINIIPDNGIPLDIAKAYKRAGGEKVVGYIPNGDCNILKKYFSHCDEIEEFDTGWSGLNTCLSLRGDSITAFGLSSGTIVEIAYTKYHKKFLGRDIPVLIDKGTIDFNLRPELEEELNIKYFNLSELAFELEQQLQHLKRGGI